MLLIDDARSAEITDYPRTSVLQSGLKNLNIRKCCIFAEMSRSEQLLEPNLVDIGGSDYTESCICRVTPYGFPHSV